SAGVRQGLQRTIEVIAVGDALGNSVDGPLLAAQTPQHVITVAGRACLVSQAVQMADAVCALVVNVTDNRRGQRAGLGCVTLGGYSMQDVITVTDSGGQRAGLVGLRRGLLQQVAVIVIDVTD